jgi:hypothetical protein
MISIATMNFLKKLTGKCRQLIAERKPTQSPLLLGDPL